VVALGALMAYADGFVITAMQGAVGAIERTGSPFATWVVGSTLLLPVFLAAVWGGLVLARRRLGSRVRRPMGVVLTVLVVAAAGTLVGTAVLLLSTAYDYHLQSRLLEALTATGHSHGSTTLQDTLAADLKGARLGGRLLVLVNVVLVGWVTAMRGGRIDVGTPRSVRSVRLPADRRSAGAEQEVEVGAGVGLQHVVDVEPRPAA
jgi:hypothetical protein